MHSNKNPIYKVGKIDKRGQSSWEVGVPPPPLDEKINNNNQQKIRLERKKSHKWAFRYQVGVFISHQKKKKS